MDWYFTSSSSSHTENHLPRCHFTSRIQLERNVNGELILNAGAIKITPAIDGSFKACEMARVAPVENPTRKTFSTSFLSVATP